MQFSTTEEHVQLVERAKALLATQTPRPSLGQLHLQAMKLLVASLEKRKFAITDRPRKQSNSSAKNARTTDTPSRPRTRHVPAAIRRAVFERDAGRCTYVDARGERCRETHRLQLHHRVPFAQQGPDTVENLTLHCPSHNALAAEQDFGAQYIAERRTAANHTSLASEQRTMRATPSTK